MTWPRSLAIVGLCAFVALTSVTLAVARGAPQPVGVMVLCIGGDVVQVAVDASGEPVGPAHACPDCLLAFHATAPHDPLPARQAELRPARQPLAMARHAAAAPCPVRQARAPPIRV